MLFAAPMLMPLPQLGVFFPFEMAFFAGSALLAIHLVRAARPRLVRATP